MYIKLAILAVLLSSQVAAQKNDNPIITNPDNDIMSAATTSIDKELQNNPDIQSDSYKTPFDNVSFNQKVEGNINQKGEGQNFTGNQSSRLTNDDGYRSAAAECEKNKAIREFYSGLAGRVEQLALTSPNTIDSAVIEKNKEYLKTLNEEVISCTKRLDNYTSALVTSNVHNPVKDYSNWTDNEVVTVNRKE